MTPSRYRDLCKTEGRKIIRARGSGVCYEKLSPKDITLMRAYTHKDSSTGLYKHELARQTPIGMLILNRAISQRLP